MACLARAREVIKEYLLKGGLKVLYPGCQDLTAALIKTLQAIKLDNK